VKNWLGTTARAQSPFSIKRLNNKKDLHETYQMRASLRGAIEDLTVAANSPMGAPDRHADKGLLLALQGRDDEAEKSLRCTCKGSPTAETL